MSFTGPYRGLLARMQQRCVAQDWFGPEIDAPHERVARNVPNYVYMGHLPEEQLRAIEPFVEHLEYEHAIQHWTKVTIINAAHDVRRKRFGYPPATHEQIVQTEAAMGFPLPPLLYDIYTQLANGGFGYWIGFVGVAGGAWSSDLGTIDQATSHRTWKLTDRVPDGLINRSDVFKCYELPDRFIPWCSHGCTIGSWIDGWTGHIYQVGVYSPVDELASADDEDFDWVSGDEASLMDDDVPDQLVGAEALQLEMSGHGEWEDVDVDVDAVPEASIPEWCYGITYEARSLQTWLERWLDTPIIKS